MKYGVPPGCNFLCLYNKSITGLEQNTYLIWRSQNPREHLPPLIQTPHSSTLARPGTSAMKRFEEKTGVSFQLNYSKNI